MRYLLGLLSSASIIANVAALPRFANRKVNAREPGLEVSDYALTNEVERRSPQTCGVSVPLELIDSSYCGNISFGSQEQSVLTLFDLNASQLAALSPTVQYCENSDACIPKAIDIHTYNPSLSHSAKNLTDPFEISIFNSTFSGVVYEDSVIIGGT